MRSERQGSARASVGDWTARQETVTVDDWSQQAMSNHGVSIARMGPERQGAASAAIKMSTSANTRRWSQSVDDCPGEVRVRRRLVGTTRDSDRRRLVGMRDAVNVVDRPRHSCLLLCVSCRRRLTHRARQRCLRTTTGRQRRQRRLPTLKNLQRPWQICAGAPPTKRCARTLRQKVCGGVRST